jgi:hypothetical protein
MSSIIETNYKTSFAIACGILLAVLALLFFRSFHPDYVLFANDAPLGLISSEANQQASTIRGLFTGFWNDLNWLGIKQPSVLPNVSFGLYLILGGPVANAKFYAPASLFLLGLCAWFFFRQLGFHPMVCILAGIAAALHTNTFSNAAWGLPGRALNLAAIFMALSALYMGAQRQDWRRYALFALSGIAVGFGIMEGFDVGALFSIYVAAFALFLVWQHESVPLEKVKRAGIAIGAVALFAALLSAQALFTLVDTQVKGIQGLEQDAQNKAQRWDWATQWSLPKVETLRVVAPGLFGYRMDTPEGGNYWGTVGRQPGWEQHRQGLSRHSGSGEYAGVLVVLVSLFAVAQSFRRQSPLLGRFERNLVWFWAGAALISLVLAWGRHAPFYQALYLLPYFSTVRNPIKFMHVFQLAALILFGIGLQALFRHYLAGPTPGTRLGEQLRNWSRSIPAFDKKLVAGVFVLLGLAVFAMLIYFGARTNLQSHLVTQGFPASLAAEMARFSVMEAGWTLLFLLISAGLLLLIMSGWLRGRRASWALVLLGVILVLDLGRANRPWIIYYDYKEKYASNPIIELLRENRAEQRVVAPFYLTTLEGAQQQSVLQLICNDWLQNHFQFYNIQSLDVIQLPRRPEEYVAVQQNFGAPQLQARWWELTNTRFLFGFADYLEALNRQFDARGRFRVHTRFTFAQGPDGGIETIITPEGPFALFEFEGILPRTVFFKDWETLPDDQSVLNRLRDPLFDPAEQVLISGTAPAFAPGETADGSAAIVELVSYTPKRSQVMVRTEQPGILLYNDRFEDDWRVRVNGRKADLLRCNYVMRGVALPSGEHQVEFYFDPPSWGLYISFIAMFAGLVLCGLVIAIGSPQAAPKETGTRIPAPVAKPASKRRKIK